MKLTNKSSIPLKKLEPLVSYVAECPWVGRPDLLKIVPSNGPGFEGNCNRTVYDSGRVSFEVTILVGVPSRYPLTWRTPYPGAGVNYHETWKEEFLHVLAHEFRHVYQWKNERDVVFGCVEVDAEKAARRLLRRWLDSQALAAVG